jgi:hypothetical protein
MPVTADEAAAALQDIHATTRRSASAYGYAHASPHLILWGVIWVAGYGLTAIRAEYAAVWPWIVAAGVILSMWIGIRSERVSTGRVDARPIATMAAVTAFIAALFAILLPLNGAQVSAFFPILIGFCYVLAGIWMRASRALVTGVVVAALTLAGFFVFPGIFMLWMAIVGGGALILGGLWMRRV